VFAKLAGLGAAGKLALACAGGTAALTACVAAGVGPVRLEQDQSEPAIETTAPDQEHEIADTVQPSPPLEPTVSDATPSPGPGQADSPPDGGDEGVEPQGGSDAESTPTPTPAPTPVAPSMPPGEQEFGAAAAAAPVQPATSSAASSSSASTDGTSAATVRQEFAP
jgi:hypothetical protein